ncbi:hypothetical protein ON010_g15352 [Phytophthora cinnamomi]|nr:hypothetical protein ON010_g15352 [Phytophthora cinnamomi]
MVGLVGSKEQETVFAQAHAKEQQEGQEERSVEKDKLTAPRTLTARTLAAGTLRSRHDDQARRSPPG